MARISPTRLLGVILLLLQGLCGLAVESYSPKIGSGLEDHWRWRQYPEVADLGVLCVEQGRDNVIWVGGDNGIMAYDGWSWATYGIAEGLTGGAVNDLRATTDGRLYAGTSGGLFEFDYDSGVWNRRAPAGCELTFHIHRVTEDQGGAILLATVWGLLKYNDERWVLTSSSDMLAAPIEFGSELQLKSISDDALRLEFWGSSVGIKVVENDFISTGKENYPLLVWAVAKGSAADRNGISAGDHVLSIDGSQPFQAWYALAGAPSTTVAVTFRRRADEKVLEVELERTELTGGVYAFSITDVIEDTDGGLWCAEARQGNLVKRLGRSDDSNWQLHPSGTGRSIPGTVRIIQTADGRVWKISQNSESPMEVFTGEGGWKNTHEATPGQLDENIHISIAQTRDGVLWAGGHDGSIHRFKNENWERLTSAEVPTPKVRLADMLETARGDLWIVGKRAGLSRFLNDTGRWTNYENLSFCAADREGGMWFAETLESVVLDKDGAWYRFGQQDGVPADVRGVIATSGGIFAFGADDGMPAYARFDAGAFEAGSTPCWTIQRVSNFATRFDENAVMEAADGAIWLGASNSKIGQMGGLLELRGDEVVHHPGGGPPLSPYAIIQDRNGVIWSGGPLTTYDGTKWAGDNFPETVRSHIHDLALTQDGSLWVATRFFGVARMLNGKWDQFTIKDGLTDNRVEGLFVDKRGILWASTPKGIGRFDGRSWSQDAYDFDVVFDNLRGSIRPGVGDDIWFAWKDRSVRYRPDKDAPRTEIINARDRYFDAGTLTFEVRGRDRLGETPSQDLAFSYRMNGGDWSRFQTGSLLQVPSVGFGDHTLEVTARDWDYNMDATPAQLAFVVVPPLWQRWWFVVSVAALLGFLALQTLRLVERDRRMSAVNRQLSLRGVELEAANEELRGFSYAVSHDLRAPLRHLAGYSSILVDDFSEKLDVEGTHLVGRIKSATHRLEDLVEGLLTLCRASNSELRHAPVDLSHVVNEVAKEAAQEYWSGRGRFEIQENMAIRGDLRLIRVVIENLVGNAAKFSAHTKEPVVNVSASTQATETIVCVQDNGAGFNMEYADNLFQPFRRLHAYEAFSGTGIGLATVSRIVKRHGGRAWAEAEEGKGASFFFALPTRSS